MVESHFDNNRLDNLDDLEEELKREHIADGFKSGLELGKEAGRNEGILRGAEEGAKLGSEVGYYRGFIMTWLQLVQSNQVSHDKLPKSLIPNLHETLLLLDEFPKTNDDSCEEKLEKIRVKFKQSTSLLNLKHSNRI